MRVVYSILLYFLSLCFAVEAYADSESLRVGDFVYYDLYTAKQKNPNHEIFRDSDLVITPAPFRGIITNKNSDEITIAWEGFGRASLIDVPLDLSKFIHIEGRFGQYVLSLDNSDVGIISGMCDIKEGSINTVMVDFYPGSSASPDPLKISPKNVCVAPSVLLGNRPIKGQKALDLRTGEIIEILEYVYPSKIRARSVISQNELVNPKRYDLALIVPSYGPLYTNKSALKIQLPSDGKITSAEVITKEAKTIVYHSDGKKLDYGIVESVTEFGHVKFKGDATWYMFDFRDTSFSQKLVEFVPEDLPSADIDRP